MDALCLFSVPPCVGKGKQTKIKKRIFGDEGITCCSKYTQKTWNGTIFPAIVNAVYMDKRIQFDMCLNRQTGGSCGRRCMCFVFCVRPSLCVSLCVRKQVNPRLPDMRHSILRARRVVFRNNRLVRVGGFSHFFPLSHLFSFLTFSVFLSDHTGPPLTSSYLHLRGKAS